jgi:hypothetical protein
MKKGETVELLPYDPLTAAFQAEGLTVEALAKALKRELRAKDEKGNDNWQIQQRARQDLMGLMQIKVGLTATNKLELGSKKGSVSLNFNLGGEKEES